MNNTNRVPYLFANIPNVTWVNGLYCCIDLDTYLKDYDADDTLTFSSSAVASITVSIDSDTNEVSFIPDSEFSGEATVTFTVNDGYDETDSNVVNLEVEEPEGVEATILYQTVTLSSVSRVSRHVPYGIPME